jgi:hypothetical protein
MATLLERYIGGEHERVWAELVALGVQVHDDCIYADALSVARETMRRARHNLKLLVSRLDEVGYHLGYDWLREDERVFAERQPPVFALPKADVLARLSDLERLAGSLPLSLRAWYETVGAVNLVGAAPRQWRMQEELDPLFVYPIEAALAEYAEWKVDHLAWAGDERNDPGPFRVPIAPDSLHKYNVSGGMWYHIVLPNPDMDAPLQAEHHADMFVAYLRRCFRWGGLPGLEAAPHVPPSTLAFLTRDLLPL